MNLPLVGRVLWRWSLVGLFLWFGIQQLVEPSAWLSFLPVWTGYLPIPGEMLIRLNGWLEVCLAIAMLLGVYTRFVSAVLGLHLLGIAVSAGGAIGMRDGVLALGTISVALNEPDAWTLDQRLKQKKN